MGATMPRPFRLFWLLGFVLVVASAGGAAWMLHTPVQDGSTDSTADTPPARPANGKSVTCAGLVDVENGLRKLGFLQPGRVVKVFVRETQEVKEGDPLMQLDDRAAKETLVQAYSDLAAARAQLATAQTGPARKQSKIAQQQAAILGAQRELAGARILLRDKQDLLAIKNARAADVEVIQNQVGALEAKVEAEKQKLAEIELVDPAQEIERAKADVAVKESRIHQAKQALDECTLPAPTDGTIIRLLAHTGDVLGGQLTGPAVQFCPKEAQIVRAEVEQEWESRVAEGMPAIIEDDTTTGKRWHGKVYRKAFVYQPRRVISQEPFQLNDVRTLECLIQLDPGQTPFRMHQKVRVIIGGAK
jgi:multidrug efflux pump subunit AcrA (membrane-fusion protein)